MQNLFCNKLNMTLLLIIISMGLFNSSFVLSQATPYALSPVVRTDTGLVQGHLVTVENSNDNVYEFSGIPYAEPPVDNGTVKRRFAKTVPKAPWKGIYLATKLPSECPQAAVYDQAEFLFLQTVKQSEDCLYLNVWAPKSHLDTIAKGKQQAQQLPVLVFFHGGGFNSGSPSLVLFNGTTIVAKQNVIFVTIQYRLGALGFAYLGTKEVPGNMGLWDQFEALRWVYQNIVFFGGDRDAITIAGQSAGAASVAFHLLSPYSRQFISKAIIHSGSAVCSWASMTKEEGLERTNRLVRLIANSSEEWQRSCWQHANMFPKKMLDCLRMPDAAFYIENLYSVLDVDKKTQSPSVSDLPWIPVIDGDFIPRDPMAMLADGDFAKVPLLSGFTKEEGSFLLLTSAMGFEIFSSAENPEKAFEKLTHKTYKDLIDSYYTYYPANGQIADPIIKEAIELHYWVSGDDNISQKALSGLKVANRVRKMLGDSALICPTITWADGYAKFQPVYQYMFSHLPYGSPTPEWYGASHAYDMPFVYGDALNTNEPLSLVANYTHGEKLLSKRAMQYLTNFVKSGDPNVVDHSLNGNLPLPKWPRYQSIDGNTLELTGDGNKGDLIEALNSRDCQFWSKDLPAINQRILRVSGGSLSTAKSTSQNSSASTVPVSNCFLHHGLVTAIMLAIYFRV